MAAGGSYSRTLPVRGARGVRALKVAVVYPTPGTAANLASFTGTVRDARGRVVGRTATELTCATGVTAVLVRDVRPGRYTVQVRGEYAASDPDTVDSDSVNGRVVFVQAAQLARLTRRR